MTIAIAVASAAMILSQTPLLRLGILVGLGGIGLAAILSTTVERTLPERPCQVPRSAVLRYGLTTASLRWGVQLGLGFQSFVVTPAIYVLLAVTLSAGSAAHAAIPWIVYGMARGSSISLVSIWMSASGACARGPMRLRTKSVLVSPLLLLGIAASASCLVRGLPGGA